MLARYAPDLVKQPFHVWLNKYPWAPLVGLGAVLYAVGGAPLFFWGTFLRVVVSIHIGGLVNCAAHLTGYRRFETRDNSRNTWWLALVAFGDNWHNNHHAHPTSARHGLAWYELDCAWLFLKGMEWCGLAWDVREAGLDEPASTSLPAAAEIGNV